MTINVADFDGVRTPVPVLPGLGEQADTGSISMVPSTGFKTLIGPTNETAPTGDTDPAGMNGRLQRIAQQQTALGVAIANMATDIANLLTAFSTPATGLPHMTPDTTLQYSRAPIDFTDSSAHDLVAAAAGETCRVHSIEIETTAACIISLYRGGTGGTLLRKIRFNAAGHFVRSLRPEPYYVSATNEKITIISSTADAYSGQIEYLRSA